MTDVEKKSKVQDEAIRVWKDNNKIGTCEILTGLGKTFLALKALYTLPKNDDIHYFLAETTQRKIDLYDDINKFNSIFNVNVLEDYNLEFSTYQSAYKFSGKSLGLLILDEVHECFTPIYSRVMRNVEYKYVLGLTASANEDVKYEIGKHRINKRFIYNKYAPIIFRYSPEDAKLDDNRRELTFHIITSRLNSEDKTIKAGNAKRRFYQTEKSAYDYWSGRLEKLRDERNTDSNKTFMLAARRKDIIWNSEDKINGVKKLIKVLHSKTIIFGDSLDLLLKITPNIVCSRNSEEVNNKIRNDFDNDKIKLIGSFKSLKQGANLVGLDNAIILTYNSKPLDMVQRVGRLRDNGRMGNIFIFLTKDTQEEVWFNSAMEDFKKDRIIFYDGIDNFLTRK